MVIAVYAGLGLVDVARFPQWLQLALHLTLTGLALFALRIGLHLALLHEAQDEIRTDEPILCMECDHVVPDMAVLRTVRCRHARIVATITTGRGATNVRSDSPRSPPTERSSSDCCPATRCNPARSR